jgi:PAS domain S-box-containing protein
MNQRLSKEPTQSDYSASGKYSGKTKLLITILVLAVVIAGLYVLSLHNYLLFHSIVDAVTVIIAIGVFWVVWARRKLLDNQYYLFIGIAFLFFGILDFFHILGYKNMDVFPGYGNLGPTFYIASRYLLSISLFVAPLFIKRKIKIPLVFAVYIAATLLVILSVLYWRNFPVTYIDGVGLTPFKMISDYIICFILLGAIGLLWINRRAFDPGVHRRITYSLIFSIITGLFFTTYTDAFGITNTIAHFFQIISFYLIYDAFINTVLTKPQDILYLSLQKNKEEITKLNTELEKVNLEQKQDITKRKQTERDLRETRDYLDSLFSYANAPIIVWNPEFKITRFNRSFEKITGLAAEEVMNKDIDILFPGDSLNESMKNIQIAATGKRWETVEIPVKHKDGEVRILLWNSANIFAADGKTLVATIAQGQDITDRIEAESKIKAQARVLEEKNNQLKLAQIAANSGIWYWDIPAGTLTWSAELLELFGLPPDTRPSFDLWAEIMHMEDRQKALDKVNAAVRDHTFLENEYRIITPAKQIRWINALGNTIYDENDKPLSMSGICIDITDRKKAERALRQSEEKYRSLNTTMSEGICLHEMIYNASGKAVDYMILDVNPAYEAFTDIKKEDAVGKKASELYGNGEPPYFDIYARVAETGKPEFFETYFPPMKKSFSISVFSPQKGQFATVFTDVTERKRTEQKLAEQAAMLAGVNDAVIGYDADYRITYWNRAAEEIYGYSAAEAMGKIGPALLEPVYTSVSREEVVKQVNSVGHLEIETERHIKGGRKVSIETHVITLHDSVGKITGYVAVDRDISERKQSEATLRETRDYLDNLFNYANAPIIVWNPEYKVSRFNHAFERLTGRTSAEVLGRKIDILFPDNNRDEPMRHIGEATLGERLDVVEIPIKHRDGSVHILLWNSANIYAPDGKTVLATIAQGQDITDRKKTEQMKDEFIGLVSHELRTPMTIINGSLRTAITEGISPEDRKMLLDNAIDGTGMLSAILENLLELSRAQAGRLMIQKEKVYIPDITWSVIEKLKSRSEEHRFQVDFPKNLPLIEADAVRVERILYNLMENAIKYSSGGTEIKVFAHLQKGMIITGVTDEGTGIRPEDLGKIFDLYERLGTQKSQGLGLGLVVCKRLVEAQGGKIWVESEFGKGTTFYFSLPVNPQKV